MYRHGPVDPGDPSSPYIPSTCSGCGSYPVASAPPLTPYQVGVELGAQPAAPHPPTISQLTYMETALGYRGSDGFTLADMAAWLPGAASGFQGNGAWDEFCQGIEGAPLSACGTNPFNGDTDIYNTNAFSQLWHGLPAWPGLAMMMAQVFAPALGGPELGGLDDLATAALDTTAEELPADALVVRGGTNTAERFANASGVIRDAAGNVYDVSVNSAPGRSLAELSQRIPNKQIGVTTIGEIRGVGGTIQLDPLENNPFHCLIGGCTPEQFSELFTPTIKNPWAG